MEEKLIGFTFKALAKTFVIMADIDKLKRNYIDKLSRMDKDKFQKRYAHIYEIIKDLPYHLKAEYGIVEHMARDKAILEVGSLDKRKIYKIIDLIPDKIIANQFKQYLYNKKRGLQKNNIVGQIHALWNEMIKKVNVSIPQDYKLH